MNANQKNNEDQTLKIRHTYKRKYTRRSKPTKKNDKEFVEPWTIEEEIALCKAFVAKSEDSVEGNGKKAAGFWREVAEHFHEEMGEDKRSYDSVNCKWKNRIRPKVWKCQSFIIQKYLPKNRGQPENTSQGNSDSAHIGVNLNDEAADSEDVEAQEVPAPMGQDRAKKKGSSSGARSKLQLQ
ncbi:ribonuclease H-like domain-containing protein [Tanacetum coccineum]|uniref:Ribonuclease H-like domain-containing protein n=1 Tax=Tanacetum coccineum TaxID=301880 RepID=A0ABQ5ABJ5_9ASTR